MKFLILLTTLILSVYSLPRRQVYNTDKIHITRTDQNKDLFDNINWEIVRMYRHDADKNMLVEVVLNKLFKEEPFSLVNSSNSKNKSYYNKYYKRGYRYPSTFLRRRAKRKHYQVFSDPFANHFWPILQTDKQTKEQLNKDDIYKTCSAIGKRSIDKNKDYEDGIKKDKFLRTDWETTCAKMSFSFS